MTIRIAAIIVSSLPMAIASLGANGDVNESSLSNKIDSRMPESTLISLLSSTDGTACAKATAEVFRRGKAIIPAMERAGAKPIATIKPPRLDVVYSLLMGNPQGDYLVDSFGLHLRGEATREDVVRMGKKYGFILPDDVKVRPGFSPTCYVNLLPGKSLFQIIRSLLEEEPSVMSINLNYFEN